MPSVDPSFTTRMSASRHRPVESRRRPAEGWRRLVECRDDHEERSATNRVPRAAHAAIGSAGGRRGIECDGPACRRVTTRAHQSTIAAAQAQSRTRCAIGKPSAARSPRAEPRCHACDGPLARKYRDYGECRGGPASKRHPVTRPASPQPGRSSAMSMAGACSIITVPDTSSPGTRPGWRATTSRRP